MFDEYDNNDPERTVKTSVVPEAPGTSSGQVSNSGTAPIQRSGSNAPTWTNGNRVESPIAEPPKPLAYFSRTTVPPPPPLLNRESAARVRARRRRVNGRRSSGEWVWVIIAGALLSVAIVFSMGVAIFLRASQAEQEVIATSVVDLSQLPTPVSFRREADQFVTGQSITLDNGYSMILEPWDGTSRFTVLFMGLDRRPGERGLAYRTDTMMLLSLDPATKQMGMLSIPRDLFVEVPGYSELQRINSPMVLGEMRQPGLGPQLAMQTVQYNLGIRVHDYILLDFTAVIELIDAIGGISITTDRTINDRLYPDMNYGYDPFYLPAGTHHLNGHDALRYARTRHGDNDFERAGRQQDVIYAIRERVLDLEKLPQLIVQAPSILNALNDNINTSMSLQQMIELAWYMRDVPAENISSGVLGPGYVQGYRTPQGASVLIPNRSRMGTLLAEVFGANYSE